MSIEDKKELIRQHVKHINEANRDAIKIRAWADKIYAPDYVCHYPSQDATRDELIAGWPSFVSAFPGFEWTINNLVAEGDTVVNVSTIRGTHKGAFMGIPATGKEILVKWVTVYRVGAGMILEGWEFPDMLGMLTQLGAIPGTVLK